MYLGSWNIDDYITFSANLHDPSDGAASDTAGTVDYRIYEDETGTPILTGTMSLLDSANTTGFYTERIQATTGNGFEAGKSYTIYIQATVNSILGTISHSLQIGARVVVTTNNDKTGYSISGTKTTLDVLNDFDPAADTVANVTTTANLTTNNDKSDYALSSAGVQAIWDALTSALTTVGSIGKLLVDNINATISSRSSHSAADVWAVGTRETTGGTIDTVTTTTTVTGVSTGGRDDIADTVLTRSVSDGPEDNAKRRNITQMILAMFRSSVSGATWSIKKSDGSTAYENETVSTDASAEPITGVSD